MPHGMIKNELRHELQGAKFIADKDKVIRHAGKHLKLSQAKNANEV